MKRAVVFVVLLVAMLTLFAGCGECEHKFGEWIATVLPTCEDAGVEMRTCLACGEKQERAVAASGHSYGEWIIDEEATCSEKGTKSRVCGSCGEVTVLEIAAKGHTEVIDNAVIATCEKEGLTEGKHCTVCNAVTVAQKTVNKLAHKNTEIVKEATCNEKGLKTLTCTVCGFVEKIDIPTKNHSYGSGVVTKTATCKEEGVKTYTCSICKTTKTESIAKLTTHSYDNGKVTKEATCLAVGNITYTCGICSNTYTNLIPKKASHAYVEGICKWCGKNDPNYVKIYKAGETWTVPGQWELSFNEAVKKVVKNGKTTVEVTWKYKNLGAETKLDIGMDDFDVYDEEMESSKWTFYDVDCTNHSGADCIVGAKATCSCGWILNNPSDKMTIIVELEDSNGATRKAKFEIGVIEPAEEPEEDKMQGCTVTCKTALPKTIHYYSYDDSIISSCIVNSISFEVSGNDLYIYFTGRKTYDKNGAGQSASCKVGWKLYDSNNNVVESGTMYTLSLANGEGFIDQKDTAYDCIKPGGTYYLTIMNVN